MKPLGVCRLIPGAVAFAVAAGLLAEPAAADQKMFRWSVKGHGAIPTVTTGVQPRLSNPLNCGEGGSMTPAPCPGASVGTTAPAAKFTLPPKAISTYYTYVYSGYIGYTSLSTISTYNGRGRFSPSNPYGATKYRRVVFPTTMGNPKPNSATGLPVTKTTTFGGKFDEKRGGSIQITPGPNRFGGTIKFLSGPKANFEQIITKFTGYYTRAQGDVLCQVTEGSGPGKRNMPIAPCTISQESKIGVIGSSGALQRKKYTALGITPIKTTMGVNDLTSKAYYIYEHAAWSTGMFYAQNPLGYKNQKFTHTGYNKDFSPPTTKTFTYTNTNMTTKGKTTTTMTTQKLTGITRIVNMVRPRLRHTYVISNNPGSVYTTPYQSARMISMRVMFLPEPGALLLLGAGMLGLAGLSILRRR